jgi:hypothetical protein
MNKQEFKAKTLPTSCGCWLWMGSVRGANYGQVSDLIEPSRYAHRLAYKLWKGALPDHLRVMHTCDVPLCVNPAHLKAGTAKDNTADCISKGRFKLPPRNPKGVQPHYLKRSV